MIIDLEKYLFIGSKEHLNAFFDEAQKRGFIHFAAQQGVHKTEFPNHLQEVLQALKILKRQKPIDQWEGSGSCEFAQKIGSEVLFANSEINRLLEERRLIEVEIARVAPFGDFSMEELLAIEEVTGRRFHFFCMKTAISHRTSFGPEVIYINTEYDLDYFIAFCDGPVAIDEMIEMRIDLPVGALKERLRNINQSLSEQHERIATLAKYETFLREICVDEVDAHNLKFAKEQVQTPLGDSLFAAIGWVPKNRLQLLKPLVEKMAVHLEPVAVEEDDTPPTCMQNRGFARIGQDLAVIYDVPSTTDKDPSLWVFWAFVLFFAMIISDGGYGLIFMAIAFFLKQRYPDMKRAAKRMVKLVFTLGVACLVWGTLTCSFFGVSFKPTSWLGEISPAVYLASRKAEYHMQKQDDVYHYWIENLRQSDLKSQKTGRDFITAGTAKREGETIYPIYNEFYQNILLEFCLLVGMIHITLSFLRYLRRNLSGIGWIACIFGGYLYFPKMLNATSMLQFLGLIDKQAAYAAGEQLLYIGLVTAPLIALIQKRLKGASEIMRLIEVFADVLSYLRLYALAIAGALMAETFNAMGQEIGLVFGILVILAGHTINLSLGIMGGVIHGLRLNFLEWYHYSFEGGGYLFQPLRKLRDEDN